MGIIILSFVLLGTVMMVFLSKYWLSEKEKLLSQNAASVAYVSARYFENMNNDDADSTVDFEVLGTTISNYSMSIDADIMITSTKGEIICASYVNSGSQGMTSISEEINNKALEGKYENKGDLNGFYKGNYYTVGIPLTIKLDGEPYTIGAVFVATSASPMNSFQIQAMQIFLIAALIALTVSFCMASFFAYSIVKPLRQLSFAVKSFGKGDFSIRVPVNCDDEIGELSVAFNDMANSLSNSEGIRRNFIANVSHELKTPMTTIAGFIDGILDGTIAEDQRDRYLKIVSDEVKRLSRLVKSMLELSRIDGGELQLQPVSFDMTKTVVSALLTFEQKINGKNLEVRGLENLSSKIVYGDQDLLHQVVYNIIENAVKFANEDGYLDISVCDGIDRTCVRIENSGAGISPEELPLVFDKFYKTDKSRSEDKNGMGLGLYLVKTIVNLHGGEIKAESKLNEFTRFEFYIPKRPKEPKASDPNVVIIEPKEEPINVFDADIVEIEEKKKKSKSKKSSKGTEKKE